MSELRVFLAVFQLRSFHKAAAAVHLTQPAVTKSIAGLEQMLGVKLFERQASGVEPTAYGLSFAPRAMAVFEELRHAAQDLASLSSGATGTLRIGTVPMPAIPFLPVAIKRLCAAQPHSAVTVVEAREAELLERLRRGDIELALLRLSLFELDVDLQAQTLFEERLMVMAGADHPLAKRQSLCWPELLEQRWVLPPPDCVFYEFVLRSLAEQGLAMPRAAVEAYSVPVQVGLAQHGGMLSFGMRSRFEFGDKRYRLSRLAINLHCAEKPVAAVWIRARELSPLAQQLLEHVQAQCDAAQTVYP
ncbi:LysR family transcriptional regulator [Paucibacter sp. TC2R-5]|uniref:LysR family transcriptional regulator n=1 Tax=Paucibacter sp. TC2R-5 TaxID=2893555 RepID=UPI0021E3C2B8|nr:LysR family transcriptional regulator [Paucibacter sp. TC2R-5]MCV2360059.1 LysR family transcriptional regulator [Paucibacter sp. TC2R-5]